MDDFLSLFRKSSVSRQMDSKKTSTETPLFLIDFDESGGAYIRIVDSKLNDIMPDYRLFSGDVFHVLRSLETIRQDRIMNFSWDEHLNYIFLKDYPYLIFQLLRCDNLITSAGERISVSGNEVSVNLKLERNDNEIQSSLYLVTDNGRVTDFNFLSDVFVLAGKTIFPVKSAGENYLRLRHFASSFYENQLEIFLSVFYSFVENVLLDFEDYELVFSGQSISSVPTIIFEKVDSDMALYLRLIHTIPGVEMNILQNFDLTYKATVTADHKVVLNRISYQSVTESSAMKLYKQIISFSPDKASQKGVFYDDNMFIVPAETASPFLLNGLPSIIKEYQLLGTEKLHEYKVKPVAPKVHLALGSGIDFLEGDADIVIDNEKFTLKQFFSQYQKQKYITLSDGNRAIVEEGYFKKIERLLNKSKSKGKVKISFFDLPEVEELLNAPLEHEAFKRHREVFEGFNKLASQKMKFSQVKADLREYQKEGVKWINYLYENNLGGCLADDMGLGKTLQTIAMLARIYPKTKKPSLLVMPKSLLFNWQSEIRKFAPQLDVYTYYGTDRDMTLARKSHVILITYAIVRNDIETYRKEDFHYVILDESQNIKNVSAQITQAVLLLNAEHRLALSGTPIENNLTELYSLFRFLNPAMFGSLEDFNSQYTYPIQKNNDKEVMMALRKKIYPFMLRRLKKDVLKELPERIEQTLYVEMEPEQASFYEERRRYYYDQVKQSIAAEGIKKSQFVMFQALNELRRISSVPESLSDGNIKSPKLNILLDSLYDAVENGHKVVVFFNYIAGIELVGDRLNEYGIDFTCMTGSTHDRKGVVERFQNDPKCKVLLMTLKTGGVGLNLTSADTVFIFEPWWNKAAEEQAINRLHRFGQKSNVLSYSIITRGSIEEKICLLQQQKAELFEGLIGSDSSSSKQLSEEDINFILG